LNADGEIYQYIAFCDPGQRYNICGSFHYNGNFVSSAVNLLADENFLPDGVFTQLEPSGDGFTSFKAFGNGIDDGTHLDNTGSLIPNWGNFTTGIITSEVDLHNTSPITAGGVRPINYSAWRMTDGEDTMCQILSYVGNGTSSRAIALTVTGRYPLFGIVIPHNKQSYFRDPSHSGSDSTRIDSADIVGDGITAVGLDSFTVGSALNENGITYEVFIILGGITGPDNGEFPSDNVPAPGTQWIQPVYNPASDIFITGDGGLILNGQPSVGLLKDISGIYTLISGQIHDTLYDRQTGQTNVNVKIPDPIVKTGYIGG